jgi:predicted porin
VSGTAFAQSSLNISGRIDLGHANTKTTTDGGSATKVTSFAGEQHGRTTSRLTFSGVEDLGGGLRAAFNYETKLNPDDTKSDGFGGTRNMYLNLSGGFGAVTIGTYLNPFDAIRGFSAATYSAPGGDFLANHINITSRILSVDDVTDIFGSKALAELYLSLVGNGLGARSTNSIGYTTPSFGGFTASLGLSQEKTSTDQTALNKQEGVIGSLAYASGPLNARLALGEGKASVKSAAVGLSSSKATDIAFAASYDLGMAVPYIQHEESKNSLATFGGATMTTLNKVKTVATELGAKFPMGAYTPYVSVSSGKVTLANEFKTTAFQIGTTYDLSKRTSAYVAIGQTKLEGDSKTNGYKIGLIHNF